MSFSASVAFIVTIWGSKTEQDNHNVSINVLFINPFKVLLSDDEIEILEGDAVQHSANKSYPKVYEFCYLLSCLIRCSRNKLLQQIVATLSKIFGK